MAAPVELFKTMVWLCDSLLQWCTAGAAQLPMDLEPTVYLHSAAA